VGGAREITDTDHLRLEATATDLLVDVAHPEISGTAMRFVSLPDQAELCDGSLARRSISAKIASFSSSSCRSLGRQM
jgi:hypothetical protein